MTDQPDLRSEISRHINNLTDALAAEEAAKTARALAIQQILGLVTELRQQAEHRHDRSYLAVIRHLYWQQPTIPSNDLTEAAGFAYPAEMTTAIGHVPSGIICDVCQQDIPRTSRSWKPPTRNPQGVVRCEPCRTKAQRQNSQKYQLARIRERHADEAGVVAPVSEWLVATRLVLAYPPISVADPNSDYRDGFWWSYELAQKLTRKLAEAAATHATVPAADGAPIVATALRVVGWDVDRTWEVLAPITQEPPTMVLTRLDRRIREMVERRKAEALDLYPDGYVPVGGWPY